MSEWVTVRRLVEDEDSPPVSYFPAFQVGDRVRVRLSGECGAPRRFRGSDGSAEQNGHWEGSGGKTGTVIRCRFYRQYGYCQYGRPYRVQAVPRHLYSADVDHDLRIGGPGVYRSGWRLVVVLGSVVVLGALAWALVFVGLWVLRT